MGIARRSVLSGGAAGVGLAVAGAVPSLAEGATRPTTSHGGHPRQHRPFPPLVDDPHGLLALPTGFKYTVVTYAGQTSLRHGQGKTPSNHDGTAVFETRHGRLQLIQNHELPAGSRSGRTHVEGTTYDAGAEMGGGCTVIETDHHGRNLRRVGRHLRHCRQLRRRPHSMGNLADLRGDRAQGRARSGRPPTGRPEPTTGPRLRLRGLRRRRVPSPSPSRRSAGTRTKPSRSTPRARRSTCPRTPAAPTACSTGGPHPAESSSAPASPTVSVPPTARSRRWPSSWTTVPCCPTSPTSPLPSSAGRSRSDGCPCPSGTARPRRCASSSPPRSPGARSSRAYTAQTRVSTSSTASPSTPPTSPRTPSSTTAWSGSTPTETRPSPWSPTSRTRRPPRPERRRRTPISSSTARTT